MEYIDFLKPSVQVEPIVEGGSNEPIYADLQLYDSDLSDDDIANDLANINGGFVTNPVEEPVEEESWIEQVDEEDWILEINEPKEKHIKTVIHKKTLNDIMDEKDIFV